MDRFYWYDGNLNGGNERQVHNTKNVRLYDGDDKTTFDSGLLTLTNLRIIWSDEAQKDRKIALELDLVKKITSESGSMFKSAKTSIHLEAAAKDKPSGPKRSSSHNVVRFSFRVGGQEQFTKELNQVIAAKEWEILKAASNQSKKTAELAPRHVGIGGIERKMQEKYEQTDQSINQAFKDLDALIEKAKDMVVLAEKFSSKLKDKQVSITDDETVAFKSYLLSMGIENPVTRETHGSGARYHEELAKQLSNFLSGFIEKEGGFITLTDVYCRFNRARGMELISPDDVFQAAQILEKMNLPVRLRKFDSGVLVIQSVSHSEEEMIQKTYSQVEEAGSLSSEELSQLLNMALTLARERLLLAEQAGKVCRDDSLEGLRFYPNKFVEIEST